MTLINVLKNELKDRIKDVRISERLTKSPLLLIADESSLDINMEKIMKMQTSLYKTIRKYLKLILIIPMIKKISNSLTKLDHKKISILLMDKANILDGNIINDPSTYMEILTELFIES